MPPSSQPDGYPLKATDPDFQIQQAIGQALENCNPPGSVPGTIGALSANELRDRGGAWLGPALKRLDWNRSRDIEGERRARFFCPLINKVLRRTSRATETELSLLCEHSEFLLRNHCYYVPKKVAEFAWGLEQGPGLSPAALDQLRRAQRICLQPGSGAPVDARFRLGWTFFRARNNSDDGDPCWSALVRRDLRKMPEETSQKLLAALDSNDHLFPWLREPPARIHKLLAGLGGHEFQRALNRWTHFLLAEGQPQLKDTGLTLLRYLLRLCEAMPEVEFDEALYHIATAKWTEPDDELTGADYWIVPYLQVLGRCPNSTAFACAEALTLNPYLREFEDVERFYRGVAERAARLPQSVPSKSVDGFPLEPNNALIEEHRMIDELFRSAQAPHAGTPLVQMDPLLPVRNALLAEHSDPTKLIQACSERVAWLKQHADEFEQERVWAWRREANGIVQSALPELGGDPGLPGLLAALRFDTINAAGHGCTRPSRALFEMSQSYVSANGWNKELAEVLRRWIVSLHGSTSMLDLRQHADYWVWFEDVAPIRTSDCWSSIVRSALRAMRPVSRRKWTSLLQTFSFTVANKPGAKWLRSAKPLVEKIGLPEFRTRYREWFAGFKSAAPLNLTTPGRNVLRLLIWCALAAEDAKVDEALSWFAQARWKTKRAEACAAKADTAFCETLGARNPVLARECFKAMVASGRAYENSNIHRAYERLAKMHGENH